jgi:hypothetical protein
MGAKMKSGVSKNLVAFLELLYFFACYFNFSREFLP